MKSRPYQLKLTPPWEKYEGFGRKLKTYGNHTEIIANPGFVMKVLRKKKTVLFFAYFLLLLLTMLNLNNFKWTKATKEASQCSHITLGTSYQNSPNISLLPQPARKRQLVYVLTTWRSGSSFFGEIFNQNPSVFFLYEPMWHIWQKLYPGDAVSLQGAARDMLSALYRCDLSVFQLYKAPGDRNVTSHGIFAATRNKVICSYPMCPAYRKDVVGMVDEKTCKKCPSQSLRVLEDECFKYNTLVIKGVRILNLQLLAQLMEDPSLDLKIVHLVRDPRAVANSRIKSKNGLVRENIQVVRSRDPRLRRSAYESFQKSKRRDMTDYHSIGAMEVICDHIDETLRTALNPPAWLKGKYMAVRYEDLVENPTNTVRKVYNFINLPVNRDIETFVHNMTSGKTNSSKPFVVSSRNATLAANAWRNLLSFQQIKQIEDLCSKSMDLLGYQRVNSVQEATDMRTSLLKESKV